jgi:glutaredoxin
MNFAVYSKDGCPYCERVKNLLTLTNLNHVVYNLDKDFTKEEFYSEFGEGSTFPQVICDDKKIGGCVDTVKYLREMNLV